MKNVKEQIKVKMESGVGPLEIIFGVLACISIAPVFLVYLSLTKLIIDPIKNLFKKN
tara:strand:- start:98 stop:268 length:171 start_codon:yes stop_codon:yes gene_type:complete